VLKMASDQVSKTEKLTVTELKTDMLDNPIYSPVIFGSGLEILRLLVVNGGKRSMKKICFNK